MTAPEMPRQPAAPPLPPQPTQRAADDEDVSVVGLLTVLLRHRRMIGAVALLAAAVTAAVTLRAPREYAANATFYPQTASTPSGVTGLAAQFGLTVPGTDPSTSPAFYVGLAESREILGDVAETRFAFVTDSGRVVATPTELYARQDSTPALRRDRAIEELRRRVTARPGGNTGMVELEVRASNPALARAMADTLLALINRFNLERRQSQAAAERRFAERRLAEVRDDLRAAENRVESFLQANRTYAESPTLRFEHDRLARSVSLTQSVHSTLVQAYEQAKLNEVRDTPVITVVESPEEPARPEPRGTVRKTLLALIGGAMLAVLLAFARDVARRAVGDSSPEYAEFEALKRAAAGEIRRPWRLFRRRRQVA